MAEYNTVPRDADNKHDALEESGVAERTDGEEDASQERPSDRQDDISSSKNERSVIHPPVHLIDCQDVGCTWPCAHHFHGRKDLNVFEWYPDLVSGEQAGGQIWR